MLAQTADISSSLGTAGLKTAALTSSYSAAAGTYYIAVLIGNGSTTAPGFYGLSTTAPNVFVNVGATQSANTLAGGSRILTISGSATALPAIVSGTPSISSITMTLFLS